MPSSIESMDALATREKSSHRINNFIILETRLNLTNKAIFLLLLNSHATCSGTFSVQPEP